MKMDSVARTITEENFDELVVNGGVPVLLDFWAPWCVPCNLMKRGVEKAAETLGPEVLVGLVNIDEQPGLVSRFGVLGTPTFVVVRGEQTVRTFAGMSTANGLVGRVREALTLTA